VALYRSQYSLRCIQIIAVHVLMTACVIHAHDRFTYSDERGVAAQEQLLIGIQALGEMGQAFESSTRSLEIILSLKREWQFDVSPRRSMSKH
jgi:hypothetical protein